MKIIFESATPQEIIDKKADCPLPLEVIPNYMGINLVAVSRISWERQKDGQLTQVTISFTPEEKNTDIILGN